MKYEKPDLEELELFLEGSVLLNDSIELKPGGGFDEGEDEWD